MWVKIALQYEDDGRPIPVHRAITIQPTLLGWYVLKDTHDYKLRRRTRVARLFDSIINGKDLVDPLYEVVTHDCEGGFMSISGVQEDPITGVRKAQGWYMALPSGEPA